LGRFTVFIDGASRSNPGPAAVGIYIENEKGEAVDEYCEYIGETTNNIAEYTALIRGLERAQKVGATEVLVYSDSQLVVRQLSGEYRVKSPHLKGLHIAALSLLNAFDNVAIEHVSRDRTTRADALANEALDKRR